MVSSCPDGIPLRIVKYYDRVKPHVYEAIFNKIGRAGFLKEWKTAKVTPVHKKGRKTYFQNYRPVSNLCSLSKVYGTCVLKRLMETSSHLLSLHQDGFRPSHSATTCLL